MEWRSTKAALSDLERLLTCGICGNFLCEPCTLENCDHNFCRKCIEMELGNISKCPDCGTFSWLKDIRLNHELSTTVAMMIKLRNLIGGNEKETNILHLPTNEAFPKPCTSAPVPKTLQKVKGVNDKNQSVTKELNFANNRKVGVKEKLVEDCKLKSEEILTVDCVYKTQQRKNYPLRNKSKRSDDSNNEQAVDQIEVKNNQSLDKCKPSIHLHINNDLHDGKCVDKAEIKKSYPLRRKLKRTAYYINEDLNNNAHSTTPKRPKLTNDAMEKRIFEAEASPEIVKSNENSSGTESTYTCVRPKIIKNINLSDNTNQKSGNSGWNRDIICGNERINIDSDKENVVLNIKRKRKRPRGIQKYFTDVTNRRHETSGTPVSQTRPVASLSPQIRNKRGETVLHLAAIKGDVSTAVELLKEGANPNAKDYAGWTPLHEACNHGHVDIVDHFLNNGALINIPGFDNDTPLHDAVANNRLAVVKLLVKKGASLIARNKQGLVPLDYATSQVMKDVLNNANKATKKKAKIDRMVDDNPSLPKVLIATGLNKNEKELIEQCVSRLGGNFVEEFSEAVTHVITSINDSGLCPRTLKYFSGVLCGKWIISIDWISDCLTSNKWCDEGPYEVKGKHGIAFNGPQKARNNRTQQFPPLLDGCSFYFRGSFNPPTPNKSDLVKLVKLGGGKILQREPKIKDDDVTLLSTTMIVTSLNEVPQVAYHAKAKSSLSCCTQFIIYDATSCPNNKTICSPFLRTAPVTWLMDCIASFELLDIPDIFSSTV